MNDDPDQPDDDVVPPGRGGPGEAVGEGVRIIGAEEAAEAAERPDVVRRRRRGQKRFGDRPDEPEGRDDLPRIRISTSDVPVADAPDRFGAVPVVRPDEAEPRWADDEGFAARPDPGTARQYGHARLVPDEPPDGIEGVRALGADEHTGSDEVQGSDELPVSDEYTGSDEVLGRDELPGSDEHSGWDEHPGWDEPSEPEADWSGGVGDSEPPDVHPVDQPPPASAAFDLAEAREERAQLDIEALGDDEPVEDDEPDGQPADREARSSSELEASGPKSPYRPAGVGEDLAGWEQEIGEDRSPTYEEARTVRDRPSDDDPYRSPGGEEPFEDFEDEDSFVLPHWTEPPTGQVPKVVAPEEPEEELATYGSQPRWRDEGERTVETDFDDLVEDAPRLGALGSDVDEEDEFAYGSSGDFFDSEVDRDPLEAFGPDDDEAPVPTRRRAPARTRGGGRGGGDGRHHDGEGGDRNLPVAIGVGVALVAVGLFCFWLGGLATTLLACVVVGAAAFEYFGAVQRRGYQPATLLGLVSIVGLLLSTYFFGLAAYPVVITLTVVLGFLWYLWVTPVEHSLQHLGITLVGFVWIGVLGSFATLFLGLGRIIEESDETVTSNPGIGVLLAAVIAAVSHDVGAYFIGRYQGHTPLSATSPNKTQEGLIGGVLTSLIATLAVVGFVGIAPIGPDKAQTFVFALLCALVAPLGDLCESFVKRDLELKDMGSVLPGHGGVLDRFDALLFVLPTAYFVTILFDTWGGISG